MRSTRSVLARGRSVPNTDIHRLSASQGPRSAVEPASAEYLNRIASLRPRGRALSDFHHLAWPARRRHLVASSGDYLRPQPRTRWRWLRRYRASSSFSCYSGAFTQVRCGPRTASSSPPRGPTGRPSAARPTAPTRFRRVLLAACREADLAAVYAANLSCVQARERRLHVCHRPQGLSAPRSRSGNPLTAATPPRREHQ